MTHHPHVHIIVSGGGISASNAHPSDSAASEPIPAQCLLP
jgi:hypothetical protein